MSVITWPAPAEEMPSPHFTVAVDDVPVFVYAARVRSEILQNDGLWTHATDPSGEAAAFCIFDCDGPVTVAVRPARPCTTAAVLPVRAGVTAEVVDGEVRFTVPSPRHLTLVLDGSDVTPLHLFIGAPETDVPSPDDPNVLYFGPGVHDITTLALQSGQTLYLAGGAVVRAGLQPDEVGRYDEKWKVTFYGGTVLSLVDVTGVRICGRGILDASRVPHPGRPMLHLNRARDVTVSGVVFRDAANWNVINADSEEITFDDLRIISGRLNSDGINSVNARHVRVRGCFVRNHDDSIVVKTTQSALPAGDIRVENCTVWNDWGYALGVTYETRADVTDVEFRGCDIIFARHWCLGIRVSDSGTIRDIRFRDTAITDLAQPPTGAYAALAGEPKLLALCIAEDCWGHDPERGHIQDVLVEDAVIHGPRLLASELIGCDAEHGIRGVTFRNIRRAGDPPATDAESLRLEKVEFAEGVVIE
jgi:hypothetical protein